MGTETRNELRCFCSRRPLLATWGVNDKNELYVHLRIYKQRRVYGEVIVTGGKVKILCRECYRWYTVRIRQPENTPELQEIDKSEGVEEATTPGQ